MIIMVSVTIIGSMKKHVIVEIMIICWFSFGAFVLLGVLSSLSSINVFTVGDSVIGTLLGMLTSSIFSKIILLKKGVESKSFHMEAIL